MSKRPSTGTEMAAFKEVLKSSKRIIAIAGAGLSAASGIPTFRGAGGLWRKYDAISLATPETFQENPSRVWQFYHYRREKAKSAVPNNAHHALAQFSLSSVRESIVPGSTFTLITQNVDGLSSRALSGALENASPQDRAKTSQPRLLEMHGRLFDVKCTNEKCGHTQWNDNSPVCPALEGTEDLVSAGAMEPNILLVELPRCEKCGSLARPGVVWFEEVPQHLDEIDDLVAEADLCLVVGTSSTVYPAASYAEEVADHGGKVAVFNIDHSSGDSRADFLFLGPCEDLLPEALGLTVNPNILK